MTIALSVYEIISTGYMIRDCALERDGQMCYSAGVVGMIVLCSWRVRSMQPLCVEEMGIETGVV